MIAACGPSAVRLATVLSSPHVDLVAVTDLDDGVVDRSRALEVDVLVMAGGTQMSLARSLAERVSADASRITVMIVDDPTSAADTQVFWPKDRIYRIAAAMEPPLVPTVAPLVPA